MGRGWDDTLAACGSREQCYARDGPPEYGANINATSVCGQTPLTVAIQYNNYTVLKLLLERWSDYNECPRLKGPHLLEVVAQYADTRTMQILAAAEHLRARNDQSYIMAQYKQRLEKRLDKSEKLLRAFDDLVSILRSDAANSYNVEKQMESGLLDRFEVLDIADDDSESSSLEFEDAREYPLSSISTSPLASPCHMPSVKKRSTF